MNKLEFFSDKLAYGKVSVVTTEDLNWWKTKNVTLVDDANNLQESDLMVLAEVLQRSDNPISILHRIKPLAPKLVVTVPNEYSWNQQYQPFTNKAHKTNYDADLLAEHLDEAGYLYAMTALDYDGWSFLGTECVVQ